MMKRNLIVCLGLLLSLCQAFAQTRYEAEDATLTSCVTATSSAASGGKYVKMQEGSMSFSVTVASEGLYLMTIYYSQTYGDHKTQNLSVNGSPAGSIDFVETSSPTDFQAAKVALNLVNGVNTIAITRSWGWVDIDYFTIGSASMDGFKLGDIVTPSSTDGAKKLYAFLKENFGKKTISGAMLGNMDNTSGTNVKAHEDISVFYQLTGKYPVLVGIDFMNSTGQSAYAGNSYCTAYTEKSLSLMEEVWALGGIPKFTWHWRDPSLSTNEFYYYEEKDHPDGTTFNFTDAMNADGSWNKSSDIYKKMIKDIDVIASYFLDLQSKGVAGIFRPLHEASGGWFWWGKQGGENCAKLYRLIYDEMVNVKGVRNLLWVWNPATPSDAAWNPGEQYYDIVSSDIYTYDQFGPVYHVYDNQVANFMKLMDLTDSKKIIALTECGSIPDVDACYSETATVPWSWWMPWYESWDAGWVSKGTEKEVWNKAMKSEYIITLDEMEGWGTYTGPDTPVVDPEPDEECAASMAKGIYEVECSTDHKTADASVANKSGKGVLMLKENDDYVNLTVSLEKAGAYKVYVGYNSIYGYKVISCAVNSIGSQVNLGTSSADPEVDATKESLAGSFNFKAGDNEVKLTPIWTYAIVDYIRIEADGEAPTYEFKVSDVDGFKVDGAKLLDRCDNEFVMRGVNLAYTWYESSAYAQLEAIANAGANTVRVVLTNGQAYGKAADDASKVRAFVDKCKEYGMLAIIEVHDVTGSDKISDLETAANYFVNIAESLKGTESYVMINIANEWHNSSAASNWCEGYKTVIPMIRNAGLRHCIMVDAGGYGQSAATIHSYGLQVLDADPENNVLFSIHMYGGAGNTNKVKANIDGVINQDLALCIGEFGWYHSDGDVDEDLILSYCDEKNVGWLAWSWYGNGSPVEYLDLVKDATATPVLASYTDLTINNWNNTETWKASCEWGKKITDAWKSIGYARLDECVVTQVNDALFETKSLYYDSVNAELYVQSALPAMVTVVDASGKTLYQNVVVGTMTISAKQWSAGVYVAMIGDESVKIVK